MSLITGVCAKSAPMTGPSYCGAASFWVKPPSALVSVGFADVAVPGVFGEPVGSCFDSLHAARPPAAASDARRRARTGRARMRRGGVLMMPPAMEAAIDAWREAAEEGDGGGLASDARA